LFENFGVIFKAKFSLAANFGYCKTSSADITLDISLEVILAE
jgi:hypothetical protein